MQFFVVAVSVIKQIQGQLTVSCFESFEDEVGSTLFIAHVAFMHPLFLAATHIAACLDIFYSFFPFSDFSNSSFCVQPFITNASELLCSTTE